LPIELILPIEPIAAGPRPHGQICVRAWLALRCNNDCVASGLAMAEEADYGRARPGA
jgi:hypothetical protein